MLPAGPKSLGHNITNESSIPGKLVKLGIVNLFLIVDVNAAWSFYASSCVTYLLSLSSASTRTSDSDT